MNKFYIVLNEASKNSWADVFWSEAKDMATIYLDNNSMHSTFLKMVKKLHFSNKINKKIRIPFKSLWDRTYSIKYNDLDKNNKNFIIFQSNIKFSPKFIKRIKKEKNVSIVLYLPDTVQGIGIGNLKKEVDRYIKYYDIDYVFSFDKTDCQKYGFTFYDIYSKVDLFEDRKEENKVFYIGNSRNDERLRMLISIYEKLKAIIECDFRIVGVKDSQKIYKDDISYNSPINYLEVIENVCKSKVLLEIVNSGQVGNTLRFKEAVCYNKKLITNNNEVKNTKYYNPKFIKIINNINELDYKWICDDSDVDFKYSGDFSPIAFLEMIKTLYYK